MKSKQGNILIFTVAILIFVLIGCKASAEDPNKIIGEDTIEDGVLDKSIDSISAWAVYWNLDVNEEISSLGDQLRSISYFEAYFDSKYEIIIPDELLNYLEETRSENYKKYLTFVNDVKKEDGEFSLKDVNMLKDILSDSKLQNEYINDIIKITKDNGFDGVEIDFEGIKKDIELWKKYIEFINSLYVKCEEEDLDLKIVLEPNTPIENIEFSEGPIYVMMCYNLHGTSTVPGEKANPEFITELIDKMDKVPGRKDFAIATGGFDWGENGKVISIDENTAEKILKKYGGDKKRDSESGCLFFEYTDENNVKHEVWYADKYTLNKWIKVINDRGYNVSLWRLGGNKF